MLKFLIFSMAATIVASRLNSVYLQGFSKNGLTKVFVVTLVTVYLLNLASYSHSCMTMSFLGVVFYYFLADLMYSMLMGRERLGSASTMPLSLLEAGSWTIRLFVIIIRFSAVLLAGHMIVDFFPAAYLFEFVYTLVQLYILLSLVDLFTEM